jgi:hydroxymethylbilane synthase
LSLAQSSQVREILLSLHPELEIEIKVIKTGGDDLTKLPSGPWGVKGLFVKEIEEALLDGSIDMAVHSAKDLPAELPEGLGLAAAPERSSPFDAFVSKKADTINNLPRGARVGTSSLRRRAQLLALRPDLIIEAVRGNVDTRIGKAESGDCHAVILAAAGLLRLKGSDYPVKEISPSLMLPAPGQGILGLEIRKDDSSLEELLFPLNHPPTRLALAAERAFMRRLGAGCRAPAAAWARVEDGVFVMEAEAAEPDGSRVVRLKESLADPETKKSAESLGSPENLGVSDLRSASALGESLADGILARGGKEIIQRALEAGF